MSRILFRVRAFLGTLTCSPEGFFSGAVAFAMVGLFALLFQPIIEELTPIQIEVREALPVEPPQQTDTDQP